MNLPRTATTAVLALLLFPVAFGHGRPRDILPGEPTPRVSDFWRRSPSRAARNQQLRRALEILRRSLNPLTSRTVVLQPALLTQARATLHRLTLDHPRDASLWYWYGHAAQIARDERETLEAWRRVWALDPDHWSGPDTAFTMGVILAKAGRYQESVRIYQRGMPRAVQLSTRGIMASNAAESAMAIGDLALAERLYRESLVLRPRDNNAAWWGLMVALDRRGHTFAAEQAAREALLQDPSLAGLIGPDVFFVPEGDVHYYLALAYQVAGRAREAQREWERFLRVQPRSPHQERAREHLRAVSTLVARYRPRAWLGRVLPPEAAREAAALVPPVERCYLARSRRPNLPEGSLPVVLSMRAGRVHAVELGWAPQGIRDPALMRCVNGALRGRALTRPHAPRILVTFQLELAP